MATYIVVGDESYRTDTEEQIAEAQAALRAAGETEARIYATPVEADEGDPEHPDAYATGAKLFATTIRDLCAEVAALVGDDGTGDLGTIVRQAVADDPDATAADIAEIVREAREDWAAEQAYQAELDAAAMPRPR